LWHSRAEKADSFWLFDIGVARFSEGDLADMTAAGWVDERNAGTVAT
jgi:hypothetical protein